MFARLRPTGFSALLIAQVALAPSMAAAAPPAAPDALAIRARLASAEGTEPDRERLVETYTLGGLAGKSVIIRHGADVRSDDVYGPLATAAGAHDGLKWHQNANGETVLEQPDPGHAVPEATTTSVERVASPLDAYVITERNAHGYGIVQYVDPATYRLLREERRSPSATVVTAYDDFRTVGGYTRAWHWTIRDGRSEDDADYRITSDDSHPDDAQLARLKIPPSRRIFVEFPDGTNKVDLPAREWDGRFIVRVQIGSRGLDFQLDTGAAGIVMDEDIVRELGLSRFGTISNSSNAGPFHQSLAIVPEMSVGDLKMHDVAVSTIPHLGGDVPKLFKVVGLLGFDFIGDVGLAIDYEHGRVTATSPEAFSAPTDPRALPLYVRLGNGQPQADVMVDGAVGVRFLLDTGASSNMLVYEFFARHHPEAMHDALYVGDGRRFLGVGGEFGTSPYRFHSVKVGNAVFRDLVAYRVDPVKSYETPQDGVLGAGFLQLFTLYIDYSNSMFYLVPNDRTDVARE